MCLSPAAIVDVLAACCGISQALAIVACDHNRADSAFHDETRALELFEKCAALGNVVSESVCRWLTHY